MIRTLATLIFLLLWTSSPAAETLTITFKTSNSSSQRWGNANIQAVWVETTTGTFLKTIGNWSARRRSSFVAWERKRPSGDTDGVMGATRTNHNAITVTWNMLPKGSTTEVPDGTYKIWFENTNADSGVPAHTTSINFIKNGTPASGTIASQSGYTDITWTYTGRTTSGPPAITSANTATGVNGTAFSYTITASNSPTSFNATNLPSGLSVNTTTGVISGTPTTTGTTAINLSATNGSGTGTGTLTLTVSAAPPPNVPPTVAISAPAIGATFNAPANIAAVATASDSDGTVTKVEFFVDGVLRHTETLAPYDFAWNAIPAGTYQLTARATDNSGATTTSAIRTVTVTSPVPAITSATSANGVVNTPFSYTITATNSPTAFNATGLPSGLSVNTTTGVISGTPTASGSFSVNLSATNGGGTGTVSLTLAIAAAIPQPTITSALSATATRGSAFTYTITATNTPTTFGATGLPAGLTVNSSTGVISGTPTTAGTSTVTLSATNGSGTGTATLSLTVRLPAPAITSANSATGSTGVAFTYTITGTNTPTSFGASGLPAGLSVNTSTGVISGTPTTAGTFTVTLTATNSTGSGTASLSLTIGSTDPVITSATEASGVIDVPFSYTITATNTPTSFGATGLPAGLSLDTTSGVISGTPSSLGSMAVTITATNATGTGTDTLNISISDGSVPPPTPESKSCGVGSVNALLGLMLLGFAMRLPLGRGRVR